MLKKKNLLILVLGALVLLLSTVVIILVINNNNITRDLNNKDKTISQQNSKINELNEKVTEFINNQITDNISKTAVEPDSTVITDTESSISTATRTYKVYFGKNPETADRFGASDFVFPVERTTGRLDVLTFSIEEFLKGPTEQEKTQGYFLGLGANYLPGDSDCSNKDFQVKIENKVARIRFCKDVIGIGTLGDAVFLEGLKKITLQFSTVESVVLLDKENCLLLDMRGAGFPGVCGNSF